MHGGAAPWLAAAPRRRPAPAASCRPTRGSRSRTASRRSSRCGSGSSAASRSSSSASSSSGSGRCRCSPGRSTCSAAHEQPAPHGADRGAARRDPRPQRPAARRERAGRRPSQLWPADLPKTGRAAAELQRLARSLHVPLRQIAARRSKQRGSDPLTPVTVQESVSRDAQVIYLLEHSERVPGRPRSSTPTCATTRTARSRAQLLGYVGEISPEQLKQLQRKGYAAGRQDRPGRASSRATTRTCAAGPGWRSSRSTRSGGRRSAARADAAADARRRVRLTLDINLQRAAEQALRYGIQPRARRTAQWAANGGAIVALDPRDGADPRARLVPDLRPARLRGPRHDASGCAAAGLTGATAQRTTTRRSNRAISGALSAGLDLQAGDGARGDAGAHPDSPYDVAPLHGRSRPQADGTTPAGLQELGPVRQRGDDAADALADSCDTYFYQLGYDFYRLPPTAGHPLQAWAATVRLRRSRPGVDVGPEAPGLLPTPEWRDADVHEEDRPGQLADRPPLEAGRLDPARDRPEGPARDAAPDGALLRDARERRQARHAAPRRGRRAAGARRPARRSCAASPPPRAAVDRRRPDGARGRPGRPLPGDARVATAPPPASSATSRSRSPARPARPRRSIRLPGYTPMLDQSWWCGYGPVASRAATRRLRADRERRPRRRRGRPGRAEGVRAVLPQAGANATGASTATDGRGTSTPARAAAARSARRADPSVASFVRRLDWVLLGAVAALVGYGLWAIAGITRTTSPATPATTSCARPSTRPSACVGLALAILIDPDFYRRFSALIYGGTLGLMLLVLLAGHGLAPLEALDRPRLLPLPAVRVREAAVRPLPRRLPRRPGQAHRRQPDRARRRSASRRSRCCSSSSSRTSARRSSTRVALFGVALRRRHALAAPRRARARDARRDPRRALAAARGRRRRAQALPGSSA